MFPFDGEACSYATPLLLSLCREFQRFLHVRGYGEGVFKKRGPGVSVLQSSISGQEMSHVEVVVDEGNPFKMGDSKGVMLPEVMNDNEFGAAGGDEAPFVAEIVDILSSFVSVVGDSTVSSLL